MKTFSLFIITIGLLSCKHPVKEPTKENSKPTITISGEYVICDTCDMVILVHHDECTTCGEISVDSGTIYLSKKILAIAEKLPTNSEDIPEIPANTVSTHELYFTDTTTFIKLWKGFTEGKNLYQAYRLTGKITDVKRRVLGNGVIENYPSFFFNVKEAEKTNPKKHKIYNK